MHATVHLPTSLCYSLKHSERRSVLILVSVLVSVLSPDNCATISCIKLAICGSVFD